MPEKKHRQTAAEKRAQNILELMDKGIVARLHQQVGPTEVVVKGMELGRGKAMQLFHNGEVVAEVGKDLKMVPVTKP